MFSAWRQKRRYEKYCKQLANSSLAHVYQPIAQTTLATQNLAETEFLVLDFETTGLTPKKDRVLSVGFTTIKNGRVQLGQSEHYFVKHTKHIPDKTVAIHHITEQEAATGRPIADIFPHLLAQLSGKVLVAHFADIEVGFLNQIARSVYHTELPLAVVDTLQLAFRLKYKDAVHVPQNALNLSQLRQQYRLPRYKAHNAMIDALATAELLLVLCEELDGQQTAVNRLLS